MEQAGGRKGVRMFERLWIAPGIKKRPAEPVRLQGQSKTVGSAMTSMPVQPAWSVAKAPPPTRPTPGKVMAKARPATNRRREDDDDGFPATQISSFPDNGDRWSPRRTDPDDERDIPIPFRSSGGWDAPSKPAIQCGAPTVPVSSSFCGSDDDRGSGSGNEGRPADGSSSTD